MMCCLPDTQYSQAVDRQDGLCQLAGALVEVKPLRLFECFLLEETEGAFRFFCWRKASVVLVSLCLLVRPADVKEGVFWTTLGASDSAVWVLPVDR